METTVVRELRRHAAENPDRPALVVPARAYRTRRPRWDTWTWATLERESDAYARGFALIGVRAGDRVLLAMHPALETFGALVGLWKLGAVPAWPDPRLAVDEVLTFAEQVRPRVLIARPRFQGRTPSVELTVTVGRRWIWRGATLDQCRLGGPPVSVAVRSEADEAIIVTATGLSPPLPVVCLQPQLPSRAAAMADALAEPSHARVVHTDPAFALLDLCLGNTVIVARSPRGPSDGVPVGDLIAAIRDTEADRAVATVEAWGDVARFGLQDTRPLPTLKTVVVVDSGVAPPLLRRLQRLRRVLDPMCRVIALYGAPEVFPIAAIDAGAALGETGEQTMRGAGRCVGRPSPELLVRILGATEDPVHHWATHLALAAGDIGEIVVGGDLVSPAYAASEANRLAKISYGLRTLHRMGQLGTIDGQGRLWVLGAMKHLIRLVDGTLIVPEVLEAMFDAQPEVERSALVAIGLNNDLLALCVESPSWQTFGPETEQALRAIAARVGCPIARILPIERLPLDPRGGAIQRDKVRRWVTETWDQGDPFASRAAAPPAPRANGTAPGPLRFLRRRRGSPKYR